MSENTQHRQKITVGIYVVAVWMVINVLLLALLIPGDLPDLNNYIEVILFVAGIIGLLTMKKAGAAFATVVLTITLSTSMGIVLLSYYSNLTTEPVFYINALRIAINAALIVYMFKTIYAGKYN